GRFVAWEPGTTRVTAHSWEHDTRAFAIVVVKPLEVSGEIRYEGQRTGPIVVTAFQVDDGHRPAASVVLPTPGPFVLRGLTRGGTVRVEAFMAVGGQHRPSASSPFASQEISLPGPVTNLVLTL